MPQTPSIVCIVDDDEAVRRFLVDTLGSIGLTTDEYASGEDFMRHWRSEGVGSILLDVRMPRVTGPEVHAWLRERRHEVPATSASANARWSRTAPT